MSDDFKLKDSLAFALFRYNQIDELNHARKSLALNQPGDGRGSGVYDPHRHEIREHNILTSWAADGSTRARWYGLASEAMRVIQGSGLSKLPPRLSCEDCNGNGRRFWTSAEIRAAEESGEIQRGEKVGLRTCETCGGTGLPAGEAPEAGVEGEKEEPARCHNCGSTEDVRCGVCRRCFVG
jgi:hypothetical protein